MLRWAAIAVALVVPFAIQAQSTSTDAKTVCANPLDQDAPAPLNNEPVLRTPGVALVTEPLPRVDDHSFDLVPLGVVEDGEAPPRPLVEVALCHGLIMPVRRCSCGGCPK